MKPEFRPSLGPEERRDLRTDIQKCQLALDKLEIFERQPDAVSAWLALDSFRLAVSCLEKTPTTRLHIPLGNSQLNEKLTALLKKIKQSKIIEFEKKQIEEETASPSELEVASMVSNVEAAILEVEIYLASVLDEEKW